MAEEKKTKTKTKTKRRKKTHYEKGECNGCIYRTGVGEQSVCDFYLTTGSRISVNSKGRCISKKKLEWKKEDKESGLDHINNSTI